MSDVNEPDLGPCCICSARGPRVRNIYCLHKLSPTPGRGWGCVVCDLPNDGATAVVCDECQQACGASVTNALVYACRGRPGVDGRVPVAELTGEHYHDMRAHLEDEDDCTPLSGT